jgi:hypothetical protein
MNVAVTQIISGKLDHKANSGLGIFVYGYAYKWDGVWVPVQDNKVNQTGDKERYIIPALVELYSDDGHYIVLENTVNVLDNSRFNVRYMIVSKTLSSALIHFSSICYHTNSLRDWLWQCGLLQGGTNE